MTLLLCSAVMASPSPASDFLPSDSDLPGNSANKQDHRSVSVTAYAAIQSQRAHTHTGKRGTRAGLGRRAERKQREVKVSEQRARAASVCCSASALRQQRDADICFTSKIKNYICVFLLYFHFKNKQVKIDTSSKKHPLHQLWSGCSTRAARTAKTKNMQTQQQQQCKCGTHGRIFVLLWDRTWRFSKAYSKSKLIHQHSVSV